MAAISRRTAGQGIVALALASACQNRPAKPETSPGVAAPSSEDVRKLLQERIDTQRQSLGMVVGLVEADARRTIAHGVLGAGNPRPVTADTVFPIASMTKLFTALLLADAVERGEVRLEDPLSRHLPDLRLASSDGSEITLLDLATHTAGLPPYPADYPPETQPAARAAYTRQQLYAALAIQEVKSGAEWRYGNIGPQLVADALARRTGMEFDRLLQSRVTGPLGMESTLFVPAAAMTDRLSVCHDLRLRPVPDDIDRATPAASSLHSSAADLMRFVAAFMGYMRTPLARAMAAMPQHRRPAPLLRGEQALGLQIWRVGSGEVMGHGGNKPGAASAMLWRRGSLGVIVLSNAAPPVTDIAFHLLDPRATLATPMKTAEVEAAALQGHVGRYMERTLGLIFVVTLEGEELVLEPVGQAPKIAMSPEGPDAFTIPRIGARIVFRADGVMWISLGGREYLADRTAGS